MDKTTAYFIVTQDLRRIRDAPINPERHYYTRTINFLEEVLRFYEGQKEEEEDDKEDVKESNSH